MRGLETLPAILILAGFAASCSGPAQRSAEERKPPEVLAKFSISKGNRPVLVPVKIGGRERLFVLDTGSTHCFLDTALKPKRGLFADPDGEASEVISAHTSSGWKDFELSDPPESCVGNLNLRDGGRVCWMDCELLRRVSGRDVRGILGMSFLKKYVVQMDPDAGSLRLLRSDGRSHPEWGRALDLQAGELKDCPYVEGCLPGGVKARLLVDCGDNGSVVLESAIFSKVRGRAALSEGLAAGAAGPHRFRTARIPSLALGGVDHQNLVVDEGTPGRIGQSLLSRYVVTFDFPAKTMYLKESSNFGRLDEEDMSGLHLWVVDKKVAVHSVDKDTPAEKAGIRTEDVILKVDGKPAAEMDIWDLRDLLKSGDGQEVKMTVKRGDAEKTFTFKLKKRI